MAVKSGSITAKILAKLEAGHTLTTADAFRLWNCTCLSQHVTSLRNQGYDIQTRLKKNTGRRGYHAVYSI